MEGVSCFFIPFTGNFFVLMLPICVICFGIALIDTALLPMLGFIVDKKYTAVYGSVYAIADISYCAGAAVYNVSSESSKLFPQLMHLVQWSLATWWKTLGSRL